MGLIFLIVLLISIFFFKLRDMKTCIHLQIKDEQNYLEEWIRYHLDLGISHFFITEDLGSTSHKEICDKFPEAELHSVLDVFDKSEWEKLKIDRTNRGMQSIFLRKTIKYLHDNYDFDWVFNLDIDEFLTFENPQDTFDSVLSQFSEYQVVSLQWQNYNASGHIYKPEGKVVDNFTTKCDCLFRDNILRANTKLGFNMKLYEDHGYKYSCHSAPDYKWCKTDFSNDINTKVYDKIYIRHYFTRSLEEYLINLFIRGDIYRVRGISDFFESNPDIDKNNPDVLNLIQKFEKKYGNISI